MLNFANLTRVVRRHPVAAQLQSLGLSGFIVGGLLRDSLLGKTPCDLDLVLDGDYDAGIASVAGALGHKAFALGDRFRTQRIAASYGNVDLSPTMGAHWEEDLLRRDFTINALGLPFARIGQDLTTDSLIDPADGLDDLERRRIVAISEKNLLEDPLRILRAFRFKVQLRFEIEDITLRLLRLHAEKLTQAAAERLREELMLMLNFPDAHSGLVAMDVSGVLTALFPEIETIREAKQNEFHHLPVLSHTLEAIRELEQILASGKGLADDVREKALKEMREIVSPPATRTALTKLALLFHDLGKPPTAQIQESGKLTFYGHQSVSQELVEPILERLRLSNRERDLVLLLIEEHLRVGFYCNNRPVSAKLVFRFHRRLGDAATMSCLHALADAYATRGPAAEPEFLPAHEEVVNAILWQRYFCEEIVAPVPLLTGDEIMDLTGLPEGPRIGELKEALLEAQVEGTVRTIQDAKDFVMRLVSE
ncbi:MAG: hypothetical protein A2Y63_06705 [Candidatus Riflebacteria bacterium RBG_13_59_9]|nr:MAG: hypothetical protein A2Y63_06705 [Candidatus Riflebacteria bacterium RBG_13_59_9]